MFRSLAVLNEPPRRLQRQLCRSVAVLPYHDQFISPGHGHYCDPVRGLEHLEFVAVDDLAGFRAAPGEDVGPAGEEIGDIFGIDVAL